MAVIVEAEQHKNAINLAHIERAQQPDAHEHGNAEIGEVIVLDSLVQGELRHRDDEIAAFRSGRIGFDQAA